MKNIGKLILKIAVVLFIIGALLFTISMSINGWNFSKLGLSKFEINTHQINEEFNNISIDTDTADITFIHSNENKIVLKEYEDCNHSVSVENNTLNISYSVKDNWYKTLISFGEPMITIYLKDIEYENLIVREDTGDIRVPRDFKIKNVDIDASTGDVYYFSSSESIRIALSTGDIEMNNVTTNSLELVTSTGEIELSNITCINDIKITTSTGDVSMENVKCDNLTSKGTTSDLEMENVLVTNKLSIERDTGDVEFDRCDANEIYIKTSTGDVEGSLLSEKIFIVDTDTGTRDYPQSTTGGKCEIKTSTGDIKIRIIQ